MSHARISRITFLLVLWSVALVSRSSLASEMRIWVDVNGMFSVEARIASIDDENVVLRRKDGGEVTVAIKMLSNADQQFIEERLQRVEIAGNPLRSDSPEQPEYQPLAILKLPPADRQLADFASIEQLPISTVPIPESPPTTLPADPALVKVDVGEANIQIYGVDVYDDCSRPIPVTTISESGTRSTSIVMSICRGSASRDIPSQNQLVRFDIEGKRAYISLNHDETIHLLDHHSASNRSLVMTGFNSLGDGGQIAVATGWGPEGIQLSHIRTIGNQNQDARSNLPELRWARWVDEEHFVAIIDQTLGLWNIVSGRQLYKIDGVSHRAVPAISGGRHYLALPSKGAVTLYETKTGKPLGRISVDRQIPGVSFSPQSDRLAIATSRRMQCWDLVSASLTNEITSRAILGTRSPIWVDSDLVLSSSGVLLSLFRGVPVWQYNISTTEIASIGNHVAIFRKQSASELSSLTIPHSSATEALDWMDSSAPNVDPATWRLLGSSNWKHSAWVDQNVRISATRKRHR